MKQNKIFLIILSFAIFVLSVLFFYESLGNVVAVLGVVPILAAAWFYGRIGGVILALGVWITGVVFLLTNVIPESHLVMVSVRSLAGVVIGFIVGMLQDRSVELKKLETETLIFKLGIEKSKDIVFITDGNGNFTYVNPTFTKIYGYSLAEVKGKTPRILKSGFKDEKFYRDFWKRIKAGESLQVDMKNMTKGGKMLEIESSINPITKDNGEVIGFLAMQRDFTDRKKTEADLIKRTAELEKINSLMVDREIKMTEMKKKLMENGYMVSSLKNKVN